MGDPGGKCHLLALELLESEDCGSSLLSERICTRALGSDAQKETQKSSVDKYINTTQPRLSWYVWLRLTVFLELKLNVTRLHFFFNLEIFNVAKRVLSFKKI